MRWVLGIVAVVSAAPALAAAALVESLVWPLIALGTASAALSVLLVAAARMSAQADRAEEARRRPLVALSSGPPATGQANLARRVRRAAAHQPLADLDPIDRLAFADAVSAARDFGDLDRVWQQLILAAERRAIAGPVRGLREEGTADARLL